ncbi:MAG: hypothetical protein KJS97_03235 [Alphaproteobacteria bacterium]|nr:hypothetical protein [Alphaproteobacteria bacterium]
MRRFVVAAAAALAACGASFATPAAAAVPGASAFDIYMNGERVGRHVVTVARAGDDVRADVRIDMAGKVGPFSFTYAHRCTETFRNGALAALDCEDKEGRRTKTLTARSDAGRISVRASGQEKTAPLGVLPSTWWRAQTVGAKELLDTRNGKVLPVRIRTVGPETVQTAAGPVAATRYQLEGSTRADLWYDRDGRWVKIAFRLRGQSFEYRMATAPDAAPRG